jgi:hypothetical protein
VWENQWELTIYSVLRTSQMELPCCLSFPSCFLYTPKFRQFNCSVS